MNSTHAALNDLATAPGLEATLAPSTAPAPGIGDAATSGSANTGQAARVGARPGVVQLAIREKAALYASYMPFIDGGGLFVPTTRAASLGDEIYLILTLMDDPNKMPVTGKVVWITPAGTSGRQQGLGVQFSKDEAGAQARNRIETLLSGALRANRPTHTI